MGQEDGIVRTSELARHELEENIAYAQASLDDAEALEPELRVEVMRTLGSCLRERYERGDDPADFARARELLEAALAAAPEGSEVRLRCLASLGTLGVSLLERYQRGGRIADLDASVEALTLSHESAEPGSPTAAGLANDLANALVKRWRRIEGEGDIVAGVLADSQLDRAIDLLRDVLPAADPDLRPFLLGSLVQALDARARRGGELDLVEEAVADIDEAIAHGEDAVAATHDKSVARVTALTDLASACILRHRLTGEPDALDEAIARLDTALDDTATLGAPAAPALNAMAYALTLRIDTPREDADDFEAICACFRATIAQAAGDPRGALDAALHWADWAMRRAAWPQATEAYDAALPIVERLLEGQLQHADRVVTMRRARELARHAAYAAAMAGDAQGAVLRFERGRGFLIGQELETAAREPVTFAEVAGAAAEHPLVYLIPTSVGGIALFVDPGGTIRIRLLPYLQSDVLEEHVGPYWASQRFQAQEGVTTIVVGSQGIEDPDPRRRALDTLCQWMWRAAMRDVVQDVDGAEAMTIIAAGGLAIVPLHAAWRPDPSGAGGRRYAGDDLRITYAPSARLVARVAAPGELGRTLAVVDPAAQGRDRLPGADAAVTAAGDVDVLRDAAATRAAVLKAMDGRRSLLFFTHGFADSDDPLHGGLALAGDDVLTVADVMRERLDGVRLAVLAACESGWTHTHLPDEALGLPAAFLAAGAAGVIGSLWRVPTVATAMLIARFYEYLEADPAQALRRAQEWLRETSNAEQLKAFPELIDADIDPANLGLWEGAHGHAHPYFWAGFVYIGR
jgi:CHAT domain-containing protein